MPAVVTNSTSKGAILMFEAVDTLQIAHPFGSAGAWRILDGPIRC
jgi:hypothetical protein